MYSHGFDQPSTHGWYSYIKLNDGSNLANPSSSNHPIGHTVVVIDEITGAFIDAVTFDTYYESTADNDLTNYLNSITSIHTIIAIVTFDSQKYCNNTHLLLQSWGCTQPQPQHRESFLFLGTPSTTYNPSWQTCMVSASDDNPSYGYFIISLFQTSHPTLSPTNNPTKYPTNAPTKSMTNNPTKSPTNDPTEIPTNYPTKVPTNYPTKIPTNDPTQIPTKSPTKVPTNYATQMLTNYPTKIPTNYPISSPTLLPTNSPNKNPTAPTERLLVDHDKYTTVNPNADNVVHETTNTNDDDQSNVDVLSNTDSDVFVLTDWMYIVIGIVATLCCLIVIVIITKRRKWRKKKEEDLKTEQETRNVTIPYNTKIQSSSPIATPLSINEGINTLNDFALFNFKDKQSNFEQDLVNNVMMDSIIHHMSTPNGDNMEIEMVDNIMNYHDNDNDDDDNEIIGDIDGLMVTPGNDDINTNTENEGETTTDSDNMNEFETPSVDDVYNDGNNVQLTLGNHNTLNVDEFIIEDNNDLETKQ